MFMKVSSIDFIFYYRQILTFNSCCVWHIVLLAETLTWEISLESCTESQVAHVTPPHDAPETRRDATDCRRGLTLPERRDPVMRAQPHTTAQRTRGSICFICWVQGVNNYSWARLQPSQHVEQIASQLTFDTVLKYS